MKNLKFIGFLMILASSLLFIQCTTDTLVGPRGADGADGIDGINGVDGVDGVDGINGVGTASCIACHSENHRDPIYDAYALSGHAKGTSWARGKSGGCAQCHNNAGFADYASGQFVDDDGFAIANPAGYAVSEAITCSGCHSDHRSFDFDNDGNDFALRTLEAVPLMIDRSYEIDVKNDSDPMGKSNTCVVCHQPRRTMAAAVDGELFQNSGHWGPHYGAQSIIFEGIGGEEIVGSMAYNAPGSATHRSKSSCVTCHMGNDENGDPNSSANHQWLSNDNSCLECHATVPTEVAGFAALYDGLAALLEEVEGWEYQYSIVRDADGEAVLDADGNLQFLDINGIVTEKSSEYVILTDADGVKLTQPFIGIIHDGHSTTGFYGRGAYWPAGAAQAGWNFLTIYNDHSQGIHNPAYTKALLTNSIEALQ